MKDSTYVVKDGKLEMSAETKQAIVKEYYSRLMPFNLSKSDLSKLGKVLDKNIPDIKEPQIIVCNSDKSNEVFALFVQLVHNRLAMQGIHRYLYYDITSIEYITKEQFDEGYEDDYYHYNDSVDILLVRMNFDDYPNMYKAYSIRNIAESRKAAGKYTIFFFKGTLSQLQSNPWSIDLSALGNKGIVSDENKILVDSRELSRITNYVSYIVLDKVKGGGKE